jgi:hypothetical protein
MTNPRIGMYNLSNLYNDPIREESFRSNTEEFQEIISTALTDLIPRISTESSNLVLLKLGPLLQAHNEGISNIKSTFISLKDIYNKNKPEENIDPIFNTYSKGEIHNTQITKGILKSNNKLLNENMISKNYINSEKDEQLGRCVEMLNIMINMHSESNLHGDEMYQNANFINELNGLKNYFTEKLNQFSTEIINRIGNVTNEDVRRIEKVRNSIKKVELIQQHFSKLNNTNYYSTENESFNVSGIKINENVNMRHAMTINQIHLNNRNDIKTNIDDIPFFMRKEEKNLFK